MLRTSIVEYNQILELIKVGFSSFKKTNELEDTLSNVIVKLFPSINNEEILKKISQNTLISQPFIRQEVKSNKIK